MLNVIMLRLVLLKAIMMGVIRLNIVMLSVIMLRLRAPFLILEEVQSRISLNGALFRVFRARVIIFLRS